MSAQQFRLKAGLKTDANVTLLNTPTGTTATSGKMLVLDNGGNVHFRTHAEVLSDIGASAGGVDSVIGGSGITVTGTTDSTVTLGTPSTLTTSTTDGVTTSSHTHAVTTVSDAKTTVSAILAANSTGGLKVNAFSTTTADFTGDVTFSQNVAVSGSLQVDGTLTYVNTTNLSVSDPLITLSANGDAATSTNDQGLLINRGTLGNVAIIWDESADEFALIDTDDGGDTAGNITIADYFNLRIGALNVEDTVTVTGRTLVDDATDATSGTDGSLQTDGGLSVVKNAYVGADLTVAGATNSTSNTTGSVIFTGGAGIAKSVTVGEDITVWNQWHYKDVGTDLVASASISNAANTYMLQIPLATYTACELILKLKAGANETAVEKVMICESGSGIVDHTIYASLGHAISHTLTCETTDGSGDNTGTSHMALKIDNSDGVTVTVKMIAKLIKV